MALLATYINAGAACLAVGSNCFAHGLPTTPDFVTFVQMINGATNICLPTSISRNATGAYATGPLATSVEGLYAVFHSIIR